MREPEYILNPMTRVKTNRLYSTGGFMITQKHIDARKPDTIGVITGIVGGHGGDVYWVAHLGDSCTAAYGWEEFELEPAKDPCPECKGTGIDWTTSHATSKCTPCSACKGSAEKPPPSPPPVSVYEHMKRNIEGTK